MLSRSLALSAALCGALASPLAADDRFPPPQEPATVESVCAEMREFARQVMATRQTGGSLDGIYSALGVEDSSLERVAVVILFHAWQRPVFVEPEDKAREITRFADEAHAGCVVAMSVTL